MTCANEFGFTNDVVNGWLVPKDGARSTHSVHPFGTRHGMNLTVLRLAKKTRIHLMRDIQKVDE